METPQNNDHEQQAGCGSADAACSATLVNYPKHVLRLVVQLENTAENLLIMEAACAAAKAMIPEGIGHGVIKLEEISFVRASVFSRPNAPVSAAVTQPKPETQNP